MREAGQGRNPAALSDVRCVLFLYLLETVANLWQFFSFLFFKQTF